MNGITKFSKLLSLLFLATPALAAPHITVSGIRNPTWSNGVVKMSSSEMTNTATTSDLGEGSNLYYTTARFNSALSGKTTSDVAEGSNLYYTASRFNTAFSAKSTTDLSEGSNLYYTLSRFNTAFSGKSTTDLAEGTNLYFTTARAQGAISVTAPITYSLGVLGCQASSGSQAGCLSSTDWTTFNNKTSTTRAINTTSPLTGGGDLSADRTIAMPVSTSSANGYLASTDWTTFNNKVATTRTISTTSPITGGGDLSADRTFAIPASTNSVNGYLTSADHTTFAAKFGTVTYTASTPARTLNSNFTPSATNAVQACYSATFNCTLSVAGTCTGSLELRSDTNATPTTVRGTISNSFTLGVGIAVATTIGGAQQICYLVPPNHNVRLVTAGTAPTLTSQSEVSIAFSP